MSILKQYQTLRGPVVGLGYSAEQVDAVLEELHPQARAFFGRPLAADWLALFADAKVSQLRDEQDQVKPAVHFLVLVLSLEGRKELLCPTVKSNLPALTHLFHQRFEANINDEQFLTQSL